MHSDVTPPVTLREIPSTNLRIANRALVVAVTESTITKHALTEAITDTMTLWEKRLDQTPASVPAPVEPALTKNDLTEAIADLPTSAGMVSLSSSSFQPCHLLEVTLNHPYQ